MKQLIKQTKLVMKTFLIVAVTAFMGYCITYTLTGGKPITKEDRMIISDR